MNKLIIFAAIAIVCLGFVCAEDDDDDDFQYRPFMARKKRDVTSGGQEQPQQHVELNLLDNFGRGERLKRDVKGAIKGIFSKKPTTTGTQTSKKAEAPQEQEQKGKRDPTGSSLDADEFYED